MNAAERALIGAPVLVGSVEAPPFPWRAVLTSVSLWGNSMTQLLMTMGWLFVVTWLPRYLDKVHGVPLGEQALMTAVPTVAGIVGMMGGGWWTDAAARRFGLRWGRRLPLMTTRFLAAAGYVVCLFLGDSAWGVIGGLSLATFSSDLGVPAIWAYAQDVGGRSAASIMGWSNMWSAVGAAIAPLVYNAVLRETGGGGVELVVCDVCGGVCVEWGDFVGVGCDAAGGGGVRGVGC